MAARDRSRQSKSRRDDGVPFALVVNEIWIQEAIATSAIDGQNLDFDHARASVMRMLGMADAGASSRDVDGLFQVELDFAALDARHVEQIGDECTHSKRLIVQRARAVQLGVRQDRS